MARERRVHSGPCDRFGICDYCWEELMDEVETKHRAAIHVLERAQEHLIDPSDPDWHSKDFDAREILRKAAAKAYAALEEDKAARDDGS